MKARLTETLSQLGKHNAWKEPAASSEGKDFFFTLKIQG